MFARDGLEAVFCCDWSRELLDQAATIETWSLEQRAGRRSLWSSNSLELIGEAFARETATICAGTPSVFVPYRAVAWLETRAGTIAAPRFDLVNRLDDKLLHRRLFQDLDVTTPRWAVIVPGDKLPFRSSARPVLQRVRGSLGQGTRLAEEDRPLASLPHEWQRDSALLVSERIGGPVLNASAVVSTYGTHIAWPSVQLVGVTACGAPASSFLYCGNDFSATQTLPSSTLEALFRTITKIASGLRRTGFLGIFGVDFIFDGERLFALEVNPRFQGSTAHLTTLERETSRISTAHAHLEAFGLLRRSPSRGCTPEPLSGSELVMWNSGREFAANTVRAPQGTALLGLPEAGTAVEPASVIGRVRLSGSVLQADYTLSRDTGTTVAAIVAEVKAAAQPPAMTSVVP